jgi:hypothetical protein
VPFITDFPVLLATIVAHVAAVTTVCGLSVVLLQVRTETA